MRNRGNSADKSESRRVGPGNLELRYQALEARVTLPTTWSLTNDQSARRAVRASSKCGGHPLITPFGPPRLVATDVRCGAKVPPSDPIPGGVLRGWSVDDDWVAVLNEWDRTTFCPFGSDIRPHRSMTASGSRRPARGWPPRSETDPCREAAKLRRAARLRRSSSYDAGNDRPVGR